VGIWGYDWSDLIGADVLAVGDDLDYEVLQPDFRADRVYEHCLASGVIHRLFPAREEARWHGLKRLHFPFSEQLVNHVQGAVARGQVVLHLPDIVDPVTQRLLPLVSRCPTVCQSFGAPVLPNMGFWRLQKNLPAKLTRLRDHFRLKSLARRVDMYFFDGAPVDRHLRAYFPPAKTKFMAVGLDTGFWRRTGRRENIRRRLRLGPGRCALLSCSVLRPSKQVHLLINAVKKLNRQDDWTLIISGSGEAAYVASLRQSGAELMQEDRLRFVGFVPDEDLRDLYEAADVFVNPSRQEGGPIAGVKALLMEVPVLTTDSGLVARWLREHHAGHIMPARDHAKWVAEIWAAMRTPRVWPDGRRTALRFFDRAAVGRAYADAYRAMLERGEEP
jgi:glycosyltransferase involved in cell wall biosynthesis